MVLATSAAKTSIEFDGKVSSAALRRDFDGMGSRVTIPV
jgi:hypothetical protein